MNGYWPIDDPLKSILIPLTDRLVNSTEDAKRKETKPSNIYKKNSCLPFTDT